MSRPLKVSREKILELSMKVFWSKGFNGTSMNDLLNATGLNKGSLYLQFPDKKTLYNEVLSYYRSEIVEKRRAQVLAATTATKGLEIFFKIIVEHCLDSLGSPGCLNTNTIIELSSHDLEINERTLKGLKGWEEFWFEYLTKAQKSGELKFPSKTYIRSSARMLVALNQGLNVVGKVNKCRETLEDIVKLNLSSVLQYKV